MLKIFVTFILALLIIQVHAQDYMSKEDILERLKVFRHCKKPLRRHLTEDSVYFILWCRSSPENNYVEFYSLVKNREQRRGFVRYQFYFINENLFFVIQGGRKRKHYSQYYLNNGEVFSTKLDDTLPLLSQEMIDLLKTRLLTIISNPGD